MDGETHYVVEGKDECEGGRSMPGDEARRREICSHIDAGSLNNLQGL